MTPSPRLAVKNPLALAVGLALLIVTLYTVNRYLARIEHTEIRREAEDLYNSGARLLAAGRPTEALDELQRANSIVRGEDRYTLGVTRALLALNRTREAEIRLEEVLRRSPNDGHANLLLARIRAASGDESAADAHYHRAIYGAWRTDPEQNRRRSRLELAEYLASRGAQEQLLSEVLLLQHDAKDDPDLMRTVARLFLAAGSTERSAQLYRQLLATDRLDIDAYLGLGEALLRAGNYRGAQDAFLGALRRDPGNTTVSARLRFAATLAQLDPTPRRMSTAEKYRRSLRLLDAVRASVEACGGTVTDPPPEPPNRRGITNELTEELLSRAERLWQERMRLCPDPPAPDDPAPLIIAKLSQQ